MSSWKTSVVHSSLDLLSEDGPLIAVNKPAGLPTQGVPAMVPSLEASVKEFLRQKYVKPGNVYLGIPHRLDRPVSGVVIFARNSKAAARLAEQFRLRQVRKWYLAVIETPSKPGLSLSRASFHEGESRADQSLSPALERPALELTDWLRKIPDQAQAEVVPEGTPGAKWASLNYRVLQTTQHHALVLIELQTGRMHQIRVQFASRGWPIVGDARYGSMMPSVTGAGSEESIALHAARLDLRHPVRYDPISLRAPLPASWNEFGFEGMDFETFAAQTQREA